MNAQEINELTDKLAAGERLELSRVPEDAYHQANGLGSSLLKAASVSLAHYKAEKEKEREPTDAMQVGSAVHCLVLEPELWEEKFVQLPVKIKVRRGKEWEAFKSEHGDKIILTADQVARAGGMAESLDAAAGHLIVKGDPEKSYWYRDPETSLLLKSRIDLQVGDGAVDLKTTAAENAYQFAQRVKLDYHMQDALYRYVSSLNDMIFLGVYSKSPFTPYMSKCCQRTRQLSDELMHDLFKQIKLAEALGDFPHKPLEMVVADIKSWEEERFSHE